MWLECPVEETDQRGRTRRTTEARDSRRGIPQGSPLSPLLANLYHVSEKRAGASPEFAGRLPERLLVEPEVFEAPAVVDAVDHRREPFDIMVATGRGSRVVNDRPGAVLGQPALDLPHQPLALVLVEFDRLPVD